MKVQRWFVSPSIWWLFSYLVLGGVFIQAQPVIGNTVQESPTLSNREKRQSHSNIESAFTKQSPLAFIGPVALRPHVNYTILYGDGLLSVPGEPTNSTMQVASIGTLLALGRRWIVDYTHTETFYSSRLLTNTSGDQATLSGGGAMGDLSWGASQSYSTSSQILAETGRQTYQRSYATGVNGNYVLGEKTILQASANRNVRLAGPSVGVSSTDRNSWTGSDWIQWSGSTGVQYAITPKLSLGVTMGFGYDDVSNSNDMSYSQPQVNLSWRPTNKISVSVNRGVEQREIQGENSDEKLSNPIYSGSVTYAPLQTTTLTAGLSRSVSASFFNNQITRSIQWSTGIEQRFFQRYFFSASMSRGNTAYISTAGALTGRDDRFTSYNTQLSTVFLRRGSIGVTYSISENTSTARDFVFKSHQIGGNIGYRF